MRFGAEYIRHICVSVTAFEPQVQTSLQQAPRQNHEPGCPQCLRDLVSTAVSYYMHDTVLALCDARMRITNG